jgi:hypothetical protein
VKPGSPTESFLIDKLTGTLRAKEGKSMPLDEETGAPRPMTTAEREFMENVLMPWISAGAPDR